MLLPKPLSLVPTLARGQSLRGRDRNPQRNGVSVSALGGIDLGRSEVSALGWRDDPLAVVEKFRGRMEPVGAVARCHCMSNSVSIAQVVRVRVVESGGLYVATSADVPTLHASAFDRETLCDEIEDSICRYFYSIDEDVHVMPLAADGDDNLMT